MQISGVSSQIQQRARNGLRDVASDFADLAETARSIQGYTYPLVDAVKNHPLINNGSFMRLKRMLGLMEHKAPLHIPGSVLIYWNPAANRKRAERAKDALIAELRERGLSEQLRDDGAVVFTDDDEGRDRSIIDGQIVFKMTLQDPIKRHYDIVKQIDLLLKENPNQRIAVMGIGGDRTADDVAVAVAGMRRIKVEGKTPYLVAVAAKGGTANDLCGITGVPDGAKPLLRFLGAGQSVETELIGLRFILNSLLPGTGMHESYYGSTWGESGALFARLEKVKAERKRTGGSVSILDYLLLLPKTVLETKTIYVRSEIQGLDGTIRKVCHGKPVPCGEIFGPLATHQLGGVTKLCFSGEAAKLALTPTVPLAVVPLVEAFVRRLLVLVGAQTFVSKNKNGGVYTMSGWRQIQLVRGDYIKMEFFEDENATKPMGVLGTLAGDAVGPDMVVKAEVIEPIPFLSDPNCDLRVQLGLSKARLPGDRITGNAISGALNLIGSYARRSMNYLRPY